jgi:hypothetical protein
LGVVRLIANLPFRRRFVCPPSTEAPSLHRNYPASSVVRASPPSPSAWPFSHELPVGKATIRFEFVYDGGGVGKGGTGTIYVDGKSVSTGRIDQTQCCAFSADEGADVGADEGTPVTAAYQVPFKFTGKIDKVTIELKEMTPSVAEETDKSRREAALKKAVSD